jgi:hypothetical protein
MKSVEFCYWLQGLFELGKPAALTEEQTALVKKHLDMVFIHEIDPSYPATQKPALDKAHAQPWRPGGDVLMRC